MHLGLKIEVHRKLKGLTQEQVAEKIGVSTRTVVTWEKTGNLKLPDASKLAKLFGISLNELVGDPLATAPVNDIPPGAMEMPSQHGLPVLAKVPANMNVAFAEAKETVMADVKYSRKDHYVLTCVGRSMHPTIYEGDQMVVKVHSLALAEYDEALGPADPQPWKALHRRVVIASVDGEEPTVKRLFVYPRKDAGFKIFLHPDNRSAESIEISQEHNIRIMGVVQLIMRDPMNFE